MTIPPGFKATPIDGPSADIPAVDPSTGFYTMQEQLRQQKVRNYVVGMGRIIPCSASGTNLITLKPNGHGGEDGESPLLEGLRFGDCFPFWAANTSTGDVTMTVVPKHGALATLKAFVDRGATQATTGDVVANSLYVAWFVPILDSNAGGFVLL